MQGISASKYTGYPPYDDAPKEGEFDWEGFTRNLAIGLGVVAVCAIGAAISIATFGAGSILAGAFIGAGIGALSTTAMKEGEEISTGNVRSAGERLAYAVFDDSMSWDEKWAYAFEPGQMVADFVTGVVIGEILDGIMAATQNKLRSIFANNDAAMREALESGTDTVTYRRVQGGEGNQSSQQRVVIDSEGNVYINKKDRNLNISIDNGEHSQYYIKNNRPGADIYEFEVPKWLDDMVKEYTIPQAGYKNNPLNQGGSAPKLTDPTTPGTCIEFPAPWIEWIEEYATNGRIISGG